MTGRLAHIELEGAGAWMRSLITELYPICRSITGDGVRQTLRRLQAELPLVLHEIPTGMAVFDWTVPKEWNIKGAWIADSKGRRIVDFDESNLHVVSYSVPVRARLPLADLRGHLFSLPDRPALVPYRTSYYDENWGFCLSHAQLETMEDGEYEVVIDSTLEDGSLTYGEMVIPGVEDDEVLITCHVCHPSMCNDNLSGIALVTLLGTLLQRCAPRYTYRLLFIPGTIGSITWLALNGGLVDRIRHGLVVSGVGDRGPISYKRSRQHCAVVDRAVSLVLERSGRPHRLLDFDPYGYDERQFCSPGFDLPVGRISRSVYGSYPEYHTSGDNLDFVDDASLADTLSVVIEVLDLLEHDRRYLNLNPRCEPQLGRRGLYRSFGGSLDPRSTELALLWVLNLSDGETSVIDIVERSGLGVDAVRDATTALLAHGLLAEVGGPGAEAGSPPQ
jgi:aminopeptidase-like protein